MCVLPKQTFYCYFAFFFLGYMWIFALFFYNTWIDDGKAQAVNDGPLVGDIQDTITVLEFAKPLPDEILQSDPYGGKESNCPELRTNPKIQLCIHPPANDTFVSGHIAVYKQWEPELTARLIEALSDAPPTDVLFMDIGANIGYYSILAAKLGFHVLAIEPYPDSISRFYESAKINGVSDKITVIKAAVSDRPGFMGMVSDSENFGNRFVLNSDERRFKFRQRKMQQVDAVVLDHFVPILRNNYPSIRHVVMKMDIQGHECYAIKGAEHLLTSYNVNPIIMEWEETRKLGSEAEESSQNCVKRMRDILANAGYRPFPPQGTESLSLDLKDDSGLNDIIWRKI